MSAWILGASLITGLKPMQLGIALFFVFLAVWGYYGAWCNKRKLRAVVDVVFGLDQGKVFMGLIRHSPTVARATYKGKPVQLQAFRHGLTKTSWRLYVSLMQPAKNNVFFQTGHPLDIASSSVKTELQALSRTEGFLAFAASTAHPPRDILQHRPASEIMIQRDHGSTISPAIITADLERLVKLLDLNI